MNEIPQGSGAMSFEDFRRSFYYGTRADMQFKFLASMPDEEAADAVAEVLARLGKAFDTGDFAPVRDVVYAAQVTAYTKDDQPTPTSHRSRRCLGTCRLGGSPCSPPAVSSGSVTTRWAQTDRPRRKASR